MLMTSKYFLKIDFMVPAPHQVKMDIKWLQNENLSLMSIYPWNLQVLKCVICKTLNHCHWPFMLYSNVLLPIFQYWKLFIWQPTICLLYQTEIVHHEKVVCVLLSLYFVVEIYFWIAKINLIIQFTRIVQIDGFFFYLIDVLIQI